MEHTCSVRVGLLVDNKFRCLEARCLINCGRVRTVKGGWREFGLMGASTHVRQLHGIRPPWPPTWCRDNQDTPPGGNRRIQFMPFTRHVASFMVPQMTLDTCHEAAEQCCRLIRPYTAPLLRDTLYPIGLNPILAARDTSSFHQACYPSMHQEHNKSLPVL